MSHPLTSCLHLAVRKQFVSNNLLSDITRGASYLSCCALGFYHFYLKYKNNSTFVPFKFKFKFKWSMHKEKCIIMTLVIGHSKGRGVEVGGGGGEHSLSKLLVPFSLNDSYKVVVYIWHCDQRYQADVFTTTLLI